MPWSNFHDQKKDEDSSVKEVKNFEPRIFTLNKTESNAAYLAGQKKGSDFVMNEATKKISGISEIEKVNEDKKSQAQFEMLKTQAYQEAYKVGLADGIKAGAEDRIGEVNQSIDNFKLLVESIENLKKDLIHQNEAHILTTIYHIAKKIACDHIDENPNLVLPILKASINLAQVEDDVTVLLAPEQMMFIENLKNISGREFDFLKNVQLEASAEVTVGGCIIETNYGVIDARVEKRIENIWSELNQALPKIKKIAG